MTRYFLGRDGGMPTPVPDEEPGNRAETLANSVFYTEVKVVPLDAIVIRRDELPEVTRNERGTLSAGRLHVPGDYALAEIEALRDGYAAVAEYLREHPPVDEEQVESAVTTMQRALPGSHPIAMVPAETVRAVLRAAIEAGVRVGGEPR